MPSLPTRPLGASALDVSIVGLGASNFGRRIDLETSVIGGATRPEQVRANAAAGRWEPGEDGLAALRDVLSAHAL